MERGASLAGLLLLMSAIHGGAPIAFPVFLRKDKAHEVLRVQKRANYFLEEIRPGNLERECIEEKCSFEEAKEIFHSREKTMEFWFSYKGLNPCNTNPCKNGGVCKIRHYSYFCICPPSFSGDHCEQEKQQCWYKNGGCWHYCQDGAGALQVACSCARDYTLHEDGKRCVQAAPFPCGLVKVRRALEQGPPGRKMARRSLHERHHSGTAGNRSTEGTESPRAAAGTLRSAAEQSMCMERDMEHSVLGAATSSCNRTRVDAVAQPGLEDGAAGLDGGGPGQNGSVEGGGASADRMAELGAQPSTTGPPSAEPGAQPGTDGTAEPRIEPSTEPSTDGTAEASAEASAEPGTVGLPSAEPSTDGTAQPSVQPHVPPSTGSAVGPSVAGRVAGGTFCPRGQCPWQVLIRNSRDEGFCGGSLIGSRWVVTAAHCLDLVRPHHVTVGDFDKYQREVSEQKLGVERSWRHPHYDAVNYNSDIALLRLSGAVAPGAFALPICLPSGGLAALLTEEGRVGTVSGWGATHERGAPLRFLMRVRVPVVSMERCQRAMDRLLTDNMFCAGYEAEAEDACKGDSGGPFAVPYHNTWFLLGIVSWGEGCAQKGKYGVYTRVANYIPWITEVVESVGESEKILH